KATADSLWAGVTTSTWAPVRSSLGRAARTSSALITRGARTRSLMGGVVSQPALEKRVGAGIGQRAAQLRLGRRVRSGRQLREPLGGLQRAGQDVLGRDQLVEDPKRERLLGPDQLGPEGQPPRRRRRQPT